jgi:hypothetical protein
MEELPAAPVSSPYFHLIYLNNLYIKIWCAIVWFLVFLLKVLENFGGRYTFVHVVLGFLVRLIWSTGRLVLIDCAGEPARCSLHMHARCAAATSFTYLDSLEFEIFKMFYLSNW